MTAKEYLQQIQMLNLKIEQKKLQLQESRDLIENISTVRTDSIRVQKSGYSDKIGDMIAKIVDLEAEIDNELIGLFELKHCIIGQLHRLKNSNHVKLLYKRYVELKSLDDIATEMNYTYQYIVELHGKALKAFEKIYQEGKSNHGCKA